MIDVKNCSGCTACVAACPQKCISMVADEDGFLYPDIDKGKCIGCDVCEKVCHMTTKYVGYSGGKAYACINTNAEIREISSSGGIFTLLAEKIIALGGIVYGAAFDENLNVYHTAVEIKEDLYKLRGSKYLQSNMGTCYADVREQLNKDRYVLFSGTPCQISGLKSFLGKEYENLVLIDIICHGVPSFKVWNKFIEYVCKKNGKEIDKGKIPQFRSKDNGWRNYELLIYFEDGTEYRSPMRSNLYMRAFLNNICLRPSCYNCHSKSLERQSDITLADFWGIWTVDTDMYDDKGTSLVFVNTKKGAILFNDLLNNMEVKEVNKIDSVAFNSSAYMSVRKPPNREHFMKLINEVPFDKAVAMCIKKKRIQKFLGKIKRIISKRRK